MKTIIVLLSILFCHSAGAQWKKIAYFTGLNEGNTYGEIISCVYFLDLPGPPRVGFAGTESELYKTTDAGISWTKVWGDGYTYDGYFVGSVCFKDSLTGWFALFNTSGLANGGCYRTTDGGNTWISLTVPGTVFGGWWLYYNQTFNRLFLSSADTTIIRMSTDLGDKWEDIQTNALSAGFAFSSDTLGIVAAYPPDGDTTTGIMRTTDGGLTWSLVKTVSYGFQPLVIPGTPICFSADQIRIIIRRSDDYGQTWRVIKDFGPPEDSNYKQIAPNGTGIIHGDLSLLYIQTDSGMYYSTDEGVTWKNDGGPTSNGNDFYSANNITMAGSLTTISPSSNAIINGGGLWEETWPQAGVAENETLDSSFFYIAGPYPNPSEPSGDNVSILVHYCSIGSVITAQVYTLLGSPVGSAVTYTSDGQVWDRLEIPAPGTSGPYYIQVSVGAYGTTLSYSVY